MTSYTEALRAVTRTKVRKAVSDSVVPFYFSKNFVAGTQ